MSGRHITRSSHPTLLFLIFVIILSIQTTRVASRFLRPTTLETAKLDGLQHVLEHGGELREEDSWNLMGLEECEDRNEECLKRRMMSEAHLDYIYTQHRKP